MNGEHNWRNIFCKRSVRANCLLLILYTAFVLFTQTLINSEHPASYYIISLLFCASVSAVISPFIIDRLSALEIKAREQGEAGIKNRGAIRYIARYIAPFAVFFSVFLFNYLAYYPGAFSLDSAEQYRQALYNSYSDWHPALHTLLAFKLPLAITGNWPGSIVLFQIICFSAALAYAFRAVYEYTNIKYAVLAFLFVVMNPQTGAIAMFPWKDVAFAICALLMLTYALRIYMSKGGWLRAPLNTVSFVVITAVATIIRHNAILFTVPLMAAVFFFSDRKRFLAVCAGIAVLIVGIKYPLYSVMNVEQPDSRQVETLGLPMTVIGAAVTYCPEVLDGETLEFAYKVAPKEVWEDEYINGIFNYVKWNESTDISVIEEYGAPEVVSMMLGCFKNAPLVSISALVSLTNNIYRISLDEYAAFIEPSVGNEIQDYGISYQGNRYFLGVCTFYRDFVTDYLLYPFINLGFLHYIIIASALAVFRLNKMRDWKRCFFILPVFIYNYGTTMLLADCDDAARFFYYTFVLTPVLLVFIYRKEQETI